MNGRGRVGAFTPVDGLKEFLFELKSMDIKIGLVTSGLFEKAWPEILSAFRTLNSGVLLSDRIFMIVYYAGDSNSVDINYCIVEL